ncbi:sulfotransferase domain-containing protein [Cerasicoccus maritimus]|uniref:sulfotransferase domain-containing protein n=1 Tax=Cerasicoccus maritimus TaxID=490089 RepID=UPI002852B346|nr:sulfotransferase domain-containing protein [Cerasicoccus maritimus]
MKCISKELKKKLSRFIWWLRYWLLSVFASFRRYDYQHVFVCGFPRSGTSLMFNMITASLDGFDYVNRETTAVEWMVRPGNYISKVPDDMFKLDFISSHNPYRKQITAIVLYRDVRDVLTSIHQDYPGDYYVDYLSRKGGRAGMCQLYDQLMKVRSYSSVGVNVIVLKYEDLVADADAVQEHVSSNSHLRFSSSFSSFYERPDRLVYGEGSAKSGKFEWQKVNKGRHGKWRSESHRERVQVVFSQHPDLFIMLKELGYEKDDAWFEEFASREG